MTRLDDAALVELQALSDAATEGPWENSGRCVDRTLSVAPWAVTVVGMEERGHGYGRYDALVLSDADAAFIAAARNAMGDLLADLRDAREALIEAEKMIKAAEDLRGSAPYYDPCGRGQPCYEFTEKSFDDFKDAFEAARTKVRAALSAPSDVNAKRCQRCGGTGDVGDQDDQQCPNCNGTVSDCSRFPIQGCATCGGGGSVRQRDFGGSADLDELGRSPCPACSR